MSGGTDPVILDTVFERDEQSLHDAISAAWGGSSSVDVEPDTADPVDPPVDEPVLDDLEAGEPVGDTAQPDTAVEPPTGYTYGDTTYTDEDLQGLIDFATGLNPQQAAQISDLLTGEYELVQRGQPAPAPASDPVPEPGLLDGLDRDMVDPQVWQVMEAMVARQDALQAELQSARQVADTAFQSQAQDRFNRAANEAAQAVMDQYGFDESEVAAIARVGAPLIERWAPGYDDPRELFGAVLDHTLWTTPKFREQALKNVSKNAATAAVDEAARTSAAIAAKTQRADAVSTSSGTIPRSEPAPRNMTRAERTAAMAQDITSLISGP